MDEFGVETHVVYSRKYQHTCLTSLTSSHPLLISPRGGTLTINRRQLHNLPQHRDLPLLPEILVPYDGLRDAFGHGLRRRVRGVLEEVQSEDAAVEFEGEARGAESGGGGADVVQEAG